MRLAQLLEGSEEGGRKGCERERGRLLEGRDEGKARSRWGWG